MTTAIVFVLTEYLVIDGATGTTHCTIHGYDMRGLVLDDWKKACQYLADGLADVLVIADESHLDPDRVPRIEVVSHHRAPGPRSPRQERTQLIRRGAAR